MNKCLQDFSFLRNVLVVLLILFCVNMLDAKIKITSVMATLDDKANLIDGDMQTVSTGKKGENSIILQFGKLKYIDKVKVYLDKSVSFDKIQVFVSDNFVQWTKTVNKQNIESKTIEFKLHKVSAMFVKVVINSSSSFNIREIELDEKKPAKNEIYKVRVKSIGETFVEIEWKTKVKTIDYLHYAKKVKGGKQSIVDVSYKTAHLSTIKKLAKGTEYIFSIVSESPDGTRIESKVYNFKTKGIPLPDIWALQAKSITPFTAKIHYKANVPTSYDVFLGKTKDNLEKIISVKKLMQESDFEILGLMPEENYFYKLSLKDKYGRVTITPPLAFRTPAYNIALGKKVGGTFKLNEAYKETGDNLAKIVDGNLNYFGGMAVSYNADNADQYVVIDLGAKMPIKRLDIYWWAISFSKNYRIDLSNDGVNWKTIKKRLDATKGKGMRSPVGDYVLLHTTPLQNTARFVRLYVTAKSPRGSLMKELPPRKSLFLCELAVIKDVK